MVRVNVLVMIVVLVGKKVKEHFIKISCHMEKRLQA
jgi:hypothetical protein